MIMQNRCLTSSISRWGTNRRTNIRLYGDQVAGEAGRCMVSRRPIEGLLDPFCSCRPHPSTCIRCNKPICRRKARPYRVSHMPFLKWLGGERKSRYLTMHTNNATCADRDGLWTVCGVPC